MPSVPAPPLHDVIILGAGMSGLAAARALAERGLKPLILEAQPRTGGRILSQQVHGTALELGAEFVHGRAPELWALLAEAGVTPVERDGTMLREDPPGTLTAEEDDNASPFAALEDLETLEGPDLAFADWLATSTIPAEGRAALTGYVEGFNAADAARISARSLGLQQRAEDATEGGRSWHLPGGYQQLTDYLTDRVRELGCELRLNTAITALDWTEGHLRLATSQGLFTAKQVILTFPLGVLQQVNRPGGIAITPEPAAILHARRMAMGHAVRFSMLFRSRWWQNLNTVGAPRLDSETSTNLSFLFTPTRSVPVWWTSRPEPSAVLTGWLGGPRAASFTGRSTADIEAAALADLAAIFAADIQKLRSSLLHTAFHDWTADPWSLGAYSYVPVGATDASAAMTHPESNTLFFAGEHTDTTGHWGTVHAALRSGLRAATQLLGER